MVEPIVATLLYVGRSRRQEPRSRTADQLLELEAAEPEDELTRERPWPKGCNTCAGLAHRVEGDRCVECGLRSAEAAE